MANQLSVPDGENSGSAFATAIAGANPTPYGSAVLQQNDHLTTGDLNTGDVGEFGSLTEFAVEFWFMLAQTLPGVDNTLAWGPESNSGGNRQLFITLKAAGNLEFGAFDDGAAYRIATGAMVLGLNLWYHVVATAQGGNVNLYVNGVLDGTSSAWGAHSVRSLGSTAATLDFKLFGSTVAAKQFNFDELAIYRTGLTVARVLEHYNAGVNRGWRKQLPGERITAALDAISSHAPRSIQDGTRSIIPRYMSGQAPLEECRLAVEAEDVDAAFFVTADGTLKFLADGHRSSSPYNTIQATFGDGAGELAYIDIDTDYSDGKVINEWNVTRSEYASSSNLLPPAVQTASDATSISRYFKRSQSLAGAPVTLDSDASAIATALLAKYKDPLYRITSISFNTIDADVADAVLRRELMDKVRILRTPPGGGSRIQQDVFIQKIEISAANDGNPWSIRWVVSPL